MQHTYQLLIEFKKMHPLIFGSAIFILTTPLIIFVIWKVITDNATAKKEAERLSKMKYESDLKDKERRLAEHKQLVSLEATAKKEAERIFKMKYESDLKDKERRLAEHKQLVSLEATAKKETERLAKMRYESDLKEKETKIVEDQKCVSLEASIKKEDERLSKMKNELSVEEILELLSSVSEEETPKFKEEIVFVNYNVLQHSSTNSYPIFRFPKKGTVVRSYKLGKTRPRGFKEETFQKSIEQYFGKDFTILGNARLNTGKKTRPFEPDIAIIDKLNANFRIDIEIDEPYAGISRQPTHCEGEDVNRDIYFVDRGWIVIRFSEYQVHLHEKDCLRYIADIIKLAIPNYNIPKELVNHASLQPEKLWDVLQAQNWEKDMYREQYLNHIFQSIEEQTRTIELDFDEQEYKEEQLVKPTLIGEVDNKKSIGINDKNNHPRDPRIKFYPESHDYRIDNTPAPSVSTVIAKFFPAFDTYHKASNLSATNPLFGLPIDKIVEIWKTRGVEAANLGKHLHEQIENFYLRQEYERTSEFHLFEQFCNDHPNLIPHRTEWRVFDEEYHIAGTIDLITKNDNGYVLFDWKRSKKIIDLFSGEPIVTDTWGNLGVGQLSTIHDTSYNRYCLQQSLYKYILEKNYGLKVSNMYLIVLYPEYDRYYKVKVPYLKDKVEYILRTL
jgi:hypothetical protein